ncbi:hypothetical protein CCR95_18995 [Thiocystis minor]|uniref:hypothetical protein n=1 Tax=Thiocystis minor TaxID=61597 RepID=UPI0019136034|nr:hypothetical protein [Thiocystis minor]MBK5966109.1 hypothetical protein [Thiocystis minor]
MLLISLHLPKTAGTSLRHVLEQRFQTGLLADYADRPLITPRPHREWQALRAAWHLQRTGLPPPVRCVHGHFLPLKYRWLDSAPVFATWLRDPVERLISHYHYWMTATDPRALPALQRRVVEQQWSLERFCLSRELRDLYHQFLFGFPVRRFAFIGLVERMEADFAVFERRFLGEAGRLALPQVNVGRAAIGTRYLQEGPLRRRIEAFHRRDVELYQAVASGHLR